VVDYQQLEVLLMALVSVVIPTYNREKFITLAIDSVLRQSFKDYEIIIVDDGSTDKTKKVLDAYCGKIKYFYQKNSGVCGALNAGIHLSQGVWIAILGSDDEWMPEYLSYQMKHAQQNPGIITHITNTVTIRPGGVKENHFLGTKLLTKFKNNSRINLETPFYTIIKYNPWFVQSAIIRRDILLNSGLFNSNLTIGEDFDLVARIALKGPFGLGKEELVCVYRREESIEHLSKQVINEGFYTCEAYAKIYKYFLNIETLKSEEKKILLNQYSSNRRALANLLLSNRRKSEARMYYKQALFLYPSLASLGKYLLSFFPEKLALRTIKKKGDVKLGREPINIKY
jgi:glycosyltransferase involved in cell wall biosynthesis